MKVSPQLLNTQLGDRIQRQYRANLKFAAKNGGEKAEVLSAMLSTYLTIAACIPMSIEIEAGQPIDVERFVVAARDQGAKTAKFITEEHARRSARC